MPTHRFLLIVLLAACARPSGPPVTVTASRDTIEELDLVRFEVHVRPPGPSTVTWKWVPLAGTHDATTRGCPGTDTTCFVRVSGTGTMFVRVTTPTATDSAHVFVYAKSALADAAFKTRGAAGLAPTSTHCPDLSGDYVVQGEDGQTVLAISQRRCDSVGVVWNDVGRELTQRGPIVWYRVDGTMRPVGHGMIAASLGSEGMTLVRQPESSFDSAPGRTTHRYKLLPDGDLCVIDWVASVRASRYTGSERERNAAAGRSYPGC
jgi:hypothetical protein